MKVLCVRRVFLAANSSPLSGVVGGRREGEVSEDEQVPWRRVGKTKRVTGPSQVDLIQFRCLLKFFRGEHQKGKLSLLREREEV